MLELAQHIIETKRGKFDPSKFDDKYENALAELVRAKLEGKPIEVRKAPEPTKVVDLMAALRASAAAAGKTAAAASQGKAPAGKHQRAGDKHAGKTSPSKRAATRQPARQRKAS